MNWLITSGCGFLGTALIQRLNQQGEHAIRVLDNLSTGTRDDLVLVAAFREMREQDIHPAPGGANWW